MRNEFRNSFDKIKPDTVSYQKMLDDIKNNITVYKNRKRIRRLGIIAAILVFVLISIPFIDNYFKPDTTLPADVAYKVVLSINPAVEFSVSDEDIIIEAKGLDPEGIKLIEGIDLAGFTLENATIVVVNKLIEQGYISAYSIDREIQLYFVDNTSDLDALDIMSRIICAGAGGYDLESTAEAINTESLSISIKSRSSSASEIAYDAGKVKRLALAFELTGGFVDYTCIAPNGEDCFSDFIDSAGMRIEAAILHYYEELYEKGYIRDDVEAVFSFNGISDDDYYKAYQLITLLSGYHGLKLGIADHIDDCQIILSYEDIDIAPVVNKYTIHQIMSPTLNKAKEDVGPAQMEILRLCYSDEEIERFFTPRHFAVVPNLIGADEERAILLCELAGFDPQIVYDEFDPNWVPEDFPAYKIENVGTVISQDINAGTTFETSSRFQVNILVDNIDEPLEEDPEETNNSDITEIDMSAGTLFEIFGSDCLAGDIENILIGDFNKGIQYEITDADIISEFIRIISGLDIKKCNTDSINTSKTYYTVNISGLKSISNICIADHDGEAILILDYQYVSTQTGLIKNLTDFMAMNSPDPIPVTVLSAEEARDVLYDYIRSALETTPVEINAGRYFIATEKTRIETWDSGFADINGYHEVTVDIDMVMHVLSSIRALEPSDIKYINADLRIELIYQEYFLQIIADDHGLYVRSRINDEWYVMTVTAAAGDRHEIYKYFVSMLGDENGGFSFDALSDTESITIYYVKQNDMKDYPENGRLSEITIDDEGTVDSIISSLQAGSLPIMPYPSRENADMVFHTANGDVWAKIKNPVGADIQENPNECTFIFNGYYWYDNSSVYAMLIDIVN